MSTVPATPSRRTSPRGRQLGATRLTKPFVASALVNAIDRAANETVDTW